MDEILVLYLDAPLQSFGYQSKFDRRTSLSYPTRSGIIGMMAAAMGIDRKDDEGLLPFKEIKLTCYLFSRASRLVDFHTVGGGYDKRKQKRNIARVAKGGVGDTVLTYREYLENAKFGVLAAGESALIRKIGAALKDPVWGLFLGRKSCIPSTPVCQGIVSTGSEGLNVLVSLAGKKPYRRIHEVESFKEGTDTLMDVPVQFDNRSFALRRVEDSPFSESLL